MKRNHIIFLLTLPLLGLMTAAQQTLPLRNVDFGEQLKTGKNIYSKGIGSGTNITANMSGVNVPATVMPCINCHNANGKGNPEGGVIPSNITWLELTKTYGGQRKNGKKYPPYTEKTLRRAITAGIDPGSNELNSAMPRFNMSINDLNCLVSYLKTLGNKPVENRNNKYINIGVALPDQKITNPAFNETIIKIMNAYCDRVNKSGGIYGRKLEADYYFLNTVNENKPENFLKFLNEKNCLTLTGFGLQDKADIIASYARIAESPALMTFSESHTADGFGNPYAFYIYPSLAAQANALVDFSKTIVSPVDADKPIIIYQNDPSRKNIADQIARHYTSLTGIAPALLRINNNIKETAAATAITDHTCIYYIVSGISINQMAQEFEKAGKHPYLFALGNLSDADLFQLPEKFKSKVYIAYSTWMTERSGDGLSLYQTLKNEYKIGNQFKNAQLDAMAVIMTLEECFKRIGKELTKEKIMNTLEGLYEFRSGLTPPVTFNINQRVGSDKIYIASFNKETTNIILASTLNSKE